MLNTKQLGTGLIRQRLSARARIRHFDALLKVAELGSVKRAAEALNLSQPAVTHLLADLEALIGMPLFHRHARGMRPTALAGTWLPLVRRMLGTVDAAAEQAAALMARARGVVRLAASGGAFASCLVKALPAFGRDHPDVLVQVQEADPQQINRLVAGDEVDMVFCQAPDVVQDGWQFRPMLQDRFAVIAGPQHPLAKRRRVTLAQLAGETWLALPPDSNAALAFEALFEPMDRLPALRLISGRVPALLWSMLANDRLVTIVPLSVARQYLDAGLLVELRLGQALPFKPQGLLLPLEGRGLAAEQLVEFLQRHTAAQPDAIAA